jgi:hypothetical protein
MVPLRLLFFFFFAWSAALGKILTLDNLRKMHVVVVDWCVCAKGMESLWTIFSIMR